jgi:hypothetical protein
MKDELIDISKLDKAEVLAALYNNSRQQGMGFLHARGRGQLSVEEARELLKQIRYFDYLHGRVMKVDLSKDKLNPWLYDRDNGQGAAAAALQLLLSQSQVSE